MEKRHKVTMLDVYVKEKKHCNVMKYLDVAALSIEITIISLLSSVPNKNVMEIMFIILSSLGASLNLTNLMELIVEKNKWQQKIDELKDQEENQSRSR